MITRRGSANPWIQRSRGATLLVAGLLFYGACSSSSNEPNGGGASAGGTTSGGGSGGTDLGVGGLFVIDPSPGGAAGSPSAAPGPWSLPEGYTAGLLGGYFLGPAIETSGDETPELPSDAPGADGAGCGSTIIGIVRDFSDDHDDFQSYCCGHQEGLVAELLGPDKKPVYAHEAGTNMTTGPEEFAEWYNTIDGVNLPHWLYINLEPNDGVYTFHSDEFFPLDGAGFGNEGHQRNYHFTTEIHTKFRYKGGEVFRFLGDDDVFVFINDHLVIDLGGVHNALSAEVELDAIADDIGLIVGERYDLDLFQAERRTSESNFRIDTTLELVDCGYVPPVVR